ncbi:helix-turn-helix domain-containing protein [Micromonospora taraxaci]|uniref:helix-turn-helix domain-containing protein n=1 Tax=Micromonospora taraxaci TaxID=1316803 RepID=UPI003C2BC929
MTAPTLDAPSKALYRIPEATTLLSLSRSVIYEQIRAGRLRTVRQGRTRLVSAAAINAYVDLLEQEAMKEGTR